jgi:dynein heavy chain
MVPLELEKITAQIRDSNKIYEILEEFRYYLPLEDIKKRYLIMITPQTILEEIENKKREIQQKKVELEDQIVVNQEEFKSTIESISRSISQFHAYNKKEHHNEIAEKVRIINEALASAQVEARKFNTHEQLFEREVTDYSKIQDLMKDFLPYSHLWLTTNAWIQNKEAWMYGDWEAIDA